MAIEALDDSQRNTLFLLNLLATLMHTTTSIIAIALNSTYPQIQFIITGNTYINQLNTGQWTVNTFVSSSFGIVGMAATYGLIDALYHAYMCYQCRPWNKNYNIYERIIIRAVNPIRWLAYSISAPLQFFVYCVITGFVNDFQLTLMVLNMFMIMYFGGIQEEWNNLQYIHKEYIAKIEKIGNSMSLVDNPKNKSSLENLQLLAVKLAPLTISSLCYIVLWVLLYINYWDRVDVHLPYSEALIIGGFITFFSFGLVMTLQTFEVGNLKRVKGKPWYFNAEKIYQILSLTAKFFQSVTLIISLSVWVAENPL